MTKGTSPLKQPACLPLADEGPAQGRAGPGPSSRPRLSPSPPPPCSGGAPAGLHPSQPGGEGEADPLFPDRRCVEARPGGRESSGSPAPHGVCVPGSLINTIRVLCASYEDYSRWLLCLQTVSRRGGAPLLPNPETFPGLRMPHQVRCCPRQGSRVQLGRERRGGGPAMRSPHSPAAQALGSGRGSLSSDGRTSWDSGYPGPPSTCTSHSLPESSALPTAGHPAQPVPVSVWGYRQRKETGGYKASVGSLVPTAPHPKRDSGYSREGTQTREHLERAVWGRAPGRFWKALGPRRTSPALAVPASVGRRQS